MTARRRPGRGSPTAVALVALFVLAGAVGAAGSQPAPTTGASPARTELLGSAAPAAGEGLVVTAVTNRTLPLRTARSGPNEIAAVVGSVTITVANRGAAERTGQVTLHWVNATSDAAGPPIDRVNVTVGAGAQSRVTLQALGPVVEGPGEYRLEARVDGSRSSGYFWIYYPSGTYFLLTTVDSPTVAPGEPATIRLRVQNTGHPPGDEGTGVRSPGMATIGASIDGRSVAGTTRWVGLDETRVVSLTIPASALEPGQNRIDVVSAAEHDRRLDVFVQPVVTVQAASTPGDAGPGVGLLGAVLAVALVALGRGLARRRDR